MEQLEPRYGSVELEHVDWNGETGHKKETRIPLVACSGFEYSRGVLEFENAYVQARLRGDNREGSTQYLCTPKDS